MADSTFQGTSPDNPQEGAACHETRRQMPAAQPVQWVIATALVIVAAALLMHTFDAPEHRAEAQPVLGGGARGVFAFSGQLSKSTFGVYVVDVDAMTLLGVRIPAREGLPSTGGSPNMAL